MNSCFPEFGEMGRRAGMGMYVSHGKQALSSSAKWKGTQARGLKGRVVNRSFWDVTESWGECHYYLLFYSSIIHFL